MFRRLLFLLIPGQLLSQTVKVSANELCWAIIHPFAAIKVHRITEQASSVYRQPGIRLQLDSFSNGGKLDAFRHVFFMAAYAQKIKIKKLRKLGLAHEKAGYKQFLKSRKEEGEFPDSLSAAMDLQNNELGFTIGHARKNLDLDSLKNMTIQKIKTGEAVIMKRNSRGAYLDCQGREIRVALFGKKWNIPKCLVSSASQPGSENR